VSGRMFTVKTALRDYFQGTLGETKLREAIRAGEIPHVRVGGRIILREDALDAWMEEQEKRSVEKEPHPYLQLMKAR
jgi:excisionase family DNA binding protein